MDEPCSALDPQSTLRIEELMNELKARYTIVIVTHNMQQAARVSDWTGFLLLGDLVEYDKTAELFSRRRTREQTTTSPALWLEEGRGMPHPRESFDRHLHELQDDLLVMGSMVEKAWNVSMESLRTGTWRWRTRLLRMMSRSIRSASTLKRSASS